MRFGYARVSTFNQDTAAQVAACQFSKFVRICENS
jgi:DNA invertase Pin-like site-specific DNA recombinase